MQIQRAYNLADLLKPQKVLVIYGPRRVGKTTLLQKFLETTKLKYKIDSGDNIETQKVLSSQDFRLIGEYVEGYDLIAIDEAQQIPNIGMGLKIIVDNFPGKTVIATGSSSFELANQVGEPLTGRKRTVTLYPISQLELKNHFSVFELKQSLEEYLIFGSYPDVVNAKSHKEKILVLHELVNSYLFKDILALENVKSPIVLLNLLKLLAFQVGSQVSLSEIATKIGLGTKTVARYLDLLEKSFVIARLGGLSRNPRNEVARKNKYYFLDNGVRNAIINQFNGVADRNDVGSLFENFVIVERMKKRAYTDNFSATYYWRTYSQQEIDLVEEFGGEFHAYECKWSEKAVAVPKEWVSLYPGASFEEINRENYLDFIA